MTAVAYEPPRPRVMCVDDEPRVLESLRDSLRRRFDVVTTTNGFEALRLLAADPCQVLLSDMRMPMVDGARFLTLAREHAPDTVRLLLTGQSTLDDAVVAVNEGEIFRLLLKPCPHRTLIEALDAAVDRHRTLVHERELSAESLHGSVRSFLRMAAAVDPDAPQRAARMRERAAELAALAGRVPLARELGWACEVAQVGVLALPEPMRRHLAARAHIGRSQAAELERLPVLAAQFTAAIPMLGPVTHLLREAGQDLVPTRHGVAGTPPAARILRIVLDAELLEARGAAPAAAFDAMRERAGRYDRELLGLCARLRGSAASAASSGPGRPMS